MNKREFDQALKSLTENGLLSKRKVDELPNEQKNALINHLVRKRGALATILLNPDTDMRWLHSMGYMYSYRNEHFEFLGTIEHQVCFESQQRPKAQLKAPGNAVSSFFFYMWNRWSKEECNLVFKDDFSPHFWEKWSGLAKETSYGAVERFYAALSDSNRALLVNRACEVYDGNKRKI